jgi:hypothetical protein
MISNSAAALPVFNAQSLQTSLTADPKTTEQALAATTLISQIAVDEFALRFNAAMVEMLNAQGATSQTSPLSKRLKAYAVGSDVPLRSTLRLA